MQLMLIYLQAHYTRWRGFATRACPLVRLLATYPFWYIE